MVNVISLYVLLCEMLPWPVSKSVYCISVHELTVNLKIKYFKTSATYWSFLYYYSLFHELVCDTTTETTEIIFRSLAWSAVLTECVSLSLLKMSFKWKAIFFFKISIYPNSVTKIKHLALFY